MGSFLKSLYFALALYFMPRHSRIREQDVPEKIKDNVHSLLNPSQTIRWYSDRGKLQAIGIKKYKNQFIVLNPFGQVVKISKEIGVKSLPHLIGDNIMKKFPGFKIMKVILVELQKSILYDIEIQKRFLVYYLTYGTNGSLIKHKTDTILKI